MRSLFILTEAVDLLELDLKGECNFQLMLVCRLLESKLSALVEGGGLSCPVCSVIFSHFVSVKIASAKVT